jgi:hypothetical protein
MGSRPKAPDTGPQIAAAKAQTDELARQQAELTKEKESIALKNTEELKGTRRRQGGRALLINTSEKGFTESNALGN